MSYIVLIQTPAGLLAMTDFKNDEGLIAEYDTEQDAKDAAKDCMACHVYPYAVVEVDL